METTTIKEAYKEAKEKQLREIAEDIIKYQNFRFKIATDKLRAKSLTQSSKSNYVNCGRRYLAEGTKSRICSQRFYTYIQEALDKHVQPLVPSFEERKKETKRNYTKKEAKPPITKIIKDEKLTTNIEYGVKLDDKIMVQKSEDEARAFINGIKFLNPNAIVKLVTIELTEVE